MCASATQTLLTRFPGELVVVILASRVGATLLLALLHSARRIAQASYDGAHARGELVPGDAVANYSVLGCPGPAS